MRPLIVVTIAVLSLPAAADEWRSLMDRLRDMKPVDHVGARSGYRLYDCAMAAARSLGSKPEQALTDVDWRPAKDRPTVEQLAATAMAECADAETKAAGVLAEPEFAAIKKSVLIIATETIRREREQRTYLRRE
jgi:hypothetical protein